MRRGQAPATLKQAVDRFLSPHTIIAVLGILTILVSVIGYVVALNSKVDTIQVEANQNKASMATIQSEVAAENVLLAKVAEQTSSIQADVSLLKQKALATSPNP